MRIVVVVDCVLWRCVPYLLLALELFPDATNSGSEFTHSRRQDRRISVPSTDLRYLEPSELLVFMLGKLTEHELRN